MAGKRPCAKRPSLLLRFLLGAPPQQRNLGHGDGELVEACGARWLDALEVDDADGPVSVAHGHVLGAEGDGAGRLAYLELADCREEPWVSIENREWQEAFGCIEGRHMIGWSKGWYVVLNALPRFASYKHSNDNKNNRWIFWYSLLPVLCDSIHPKYTYRINVNFTDKPRLFFMGLPLTYNL